MRNFMWKAFKTKKEAVEFKKTKNNSSKIFNLKSEKDQLERLGRTECLAAYQEVDKGFNWVVEWIDVM